MTEFSSLVRRVVAANAGPYTYQGTCSYLVGRGDLAVIDPGPADAAHVDALLAAVRDGERVTHILVTHTHTDHASAAGAVQARTGAAIWGFGPMAATPGAATAAAGGAVLDVDHRLKDGDVLAGGTWTLEAVHTPGHASNHLCYALTEAGDLFTGDHVMGWATTVIPPPDGSLADYLDSLARLQERPQDRRYLPGHGPPVTDPQQIVRGFLSHRRERSAEILAVLGHGPATLDDLVRELYPGRQNVWPAAASSVFAHLLNLRDTGDVGVVGGGALLRTSRFTRPG